MSPLRTLLAEVARLGIELYVRRGRIKAAPRGRLTPELRKRIAERKAELLEALGGDPRPPGAEQGPHAARLAARALILDLRGRYGVELRVRDGRVEPDPPGRLPPLLRGEVRRREHALLELLESAGGTPPPPASLPELLARVRTAGATLHRPETLLGEAAGQSVDDDRRALEAQGAELVAEGVAARPAGQLPQGLREEVRRRAAELAAIFDESEGPPPPQGREPGDPAAAAESPPRTACHETAAELEWLRSLLASGELDGRGPFQLDPARRVVEPERFAESLVRDLTAANTPPLRRRAALREVRLFRDALEGPAREGGDGAG